MEDRADVPEALGRGERFLELVGVEIVREVQGNEMLPFLRTIQAVDHQDVGYTSTVEAPNNGAAYKASAARDYGPSESEVVHRSEFSNPSAWMTSPFYGLIGRSC